MLHTSPNASNTATVNCNRKHWSGRGTLQTGIGVVATAECRRNNGARDWRRQVRAGEGQGVGGEWDVKGVAWERRT